MAQGALGGLVISLAGNSTSFTSAMEQAEVAAAKTAKAVTARFEELNSSIERRIVGIGSALVAGFSVAAFAGQIKAVAEFRAKLDDLADAGLGSVEALSKLQQAAKLSGGNFDEITSGLQKMVKGLAGSEKETSQAGEALRRLGVAARDSAGNLRDPADVMQDVAKRFAQYADGADKAAFAQAIFGRGGAALLPVLKDMAEFGELQAKVSSKQAAEAENFNKALTRMQIALEGSSKKIAGEMIPAATALFQTIEQLAKSSSGAKGAIDGMVKSGELQDWAASGVQAIAIVINSVDGLYRMVKLAGEFWGFAAAQAVEFGRAAMGALQLAMGPAYWKEGLANISKAATGLARNREEFKGIAASILEAELAGDKLLKKFQDNYRVVKLLGQAMAGDFGDQISRRFGTATKASLDSNGLGDAPAKAAAEAVSEYAKAIEHLRERLAVLGAEMAAGDRHLSETEKWFVKIAASGKLAADMLTGTAAAMYLYARAMEESQRIAAAWQKFNAEQMRLDSDAAALHAKTVGDAVAALEDEADRLQDEYRLIGLTTEERERAVLTLKYEAAMRQAVTDQQRAGITLAYEEATAQLKANQARQASTEFSLKAIAEQQRTFEEFTKQVTDVGTDAFMRLWDGGRDGFKSLMSDLWKWFKQLVARMLSEKIIVPVIMSAVGMPGTAGASALGSLFSGGSAVSGMDLGMTSTLSSLGSFATNFAGTVSTFSNVVGNFAFATESLAAGNIASALGALGPYAAAIAAVYMIYEAFKDKGENWKARLGYGSNANAYATDTVFGRVGFTNIAGDDALNRQIQAFFESFRGFDERILKTLKDGQETAIRAAVSSLASAREFAFPKGDETAGQQLTQQVLQEYYGAIFEALGADYERFTATIKNWAGSVEDLLKTIDAMVGALELVSSGTIKGLTIPILEEWQREGESLSQTMQRIVTNFATFVDKFAPEQFKLDLMVQPFTDAMKDLNVALPASRAGFFDYVQSLDLADAAQRAIYDEIMNRWLPAADAYYQAVERQAQAQQQAADTVAQALESLMTPSERLAAAQALLASHNITSRETLIAYINSLDASTEAGRAAIAMLGGVLKAFDLIANANPDMAGLNRFRNTTHIISGEAAAAAEAVDQASEALDNLAAAADTFRAYVDTAIGQQQALLSRYGSASTLEDMQRAVDGIRQQFEAAGIAAPATTSAIAAMAAGLDATTPRGIALLGMLTQLAEAMDALQAATDAAAKAAEEAAKAAADALAQQWEAIRAEEEARRAERDAIASFFDRIKTDSEKLADATALLKGFGLLGIDTLDGFRTALQGLITQGLIGSDMLDKLYDAWQRANQRGAEVGSGPGGEQLDTAARASALTAFFDSLQSAAERLASARQLLLGAGIDARYTTLDGLRSRLRELADQGATVDSLKAIADAFDAVQVAAAQAATDVVAGAAERAKYIADIQAIWSSLTSGAERLAASTALLTSRGLGAGTTATQLQDWITQMARVGMAAADVQAIVDAWQMVTAAAQEASDAAAQAAEEAVRAAVERARAISSVFDSLLTESEKLGRANNILNQYGIRAGAGLDDVRAVLQQMADSGGTVEEMQAIADAWGTVSTAAQQAADAAAQAMVDAAGKLAHEIKQALANVARAAEFRQGIGDTIARLLASRPGANYGAYLTGNVSTARNMFAGAQGFDAQLNAAGRLQTALQTRYEYEMQALTAARDAQIQAQQQAVQAAQQLGQAFKGLGDYARSLLTGDLSPLSAEDKLAAAAQQYRDLLAKAQGGDSSAASSLQGAAQSYLQLAGDYFARNNPAYIAAFNDVQGNLAALGSRGDAQLQYAASAAASLSAMANTLTPQMIALQDQYVTDLGDLSDAVGDAQELQQQAAENAAMAYAEIAASNAEVAANTANLPQDVRELIAEMIASRETTAALLQTIAANTGSAATASASIAASSEAAVFLSGTAIGAPTL